MKHTLKLFAALLLVVTTAQAHDTWLQTNTNVVRVGDVIYIDYLLGNHGNEHRDFKIAGKPTLGTAETWDVIDPDGKSFDLKAGAIDQGYAPKEGYWTARFQPAKPGLYVSAQTSDKIVDYAPKRSVKSAKAFFVGTQNPTKAPPNVSGFDRVLGHALELVPLDNPVLPMGPGEKLRVRLLFKGKPVVGETVSFIPRGQPLSESFDPTYERKTDDQGVATFEFKDANTYLIVAHVSDTSESGKGEGYDETKYGATLTVFVPAICSCCGE